MAPSKKSSIITGMLLIALGSYSFINKPGSKDKLATSFAVIELFTSEGCSSCPPADELISKIEKESRGKDIYILSYHVDYWNRLGWKDQFSSAAFSKRQNNYSIWLKLSSVYTPQAIVNGKSEFVGSEEGTLRTAIKKSLSIQSPARIVLSNIKKLGEKIDFRYQIDGIPDNTSLVLALIQKNAVSKVLRGENAGRQLSHVQIVKNIQTIEIRDKHTGEASISIPAEVRGNVEIIALLQKNNTGEIIGAARSPSGISSKNSGVSQKSK
ncbi:DUF1223 domain-containing protein [Pedobacter frigidisoli]|uniref:DUF1223 domain-containing protein n=1 Tax=Pedobacter frigidisoli TaxID=2530455 RepID=A0A4R0P294_9SPHI|nr:DUF1223 domain-containing protein [Pedobacter frigidisoli]TCD07662.1 DUF1223 domain-containing protein [Pedobacter frigidisoli]